MKRLHRCEGCGAEITGEFPVGWFGCGRTRYDDTRASGIAEWCESCGEKQPWHPDMRPQASNWLPIESAPQDGTRILALTEHRMLMVVYWRKGWTGWHTQPGDYNKRVTHWQPLPDAPA